MWPHGSCAGCGTRRGCGVTQPSLLDLLQPEPPAVATCPCCGCTADADLIRDWHGINPDGTILGWPVGEHPVYGALCHEQWDAAVAIQYATHSAPSWLPGARATARRLGLDPDLVIAAWAEGVSPARRDVKRRVDAA